MSNIQFTFENFWGMSEDDSLGQKGQVLFAEGLDLTSNLYSINLAQKPKAFLSLTGEPIGGFVVDVGQYYFPVFCTRDEKMYKGTTQVFTGIKVRDFWTTSKYLYMIDDAEDIHRILLSDTNLADWSGKVTKTDTNLVSDVSKVHHIITREAFTYIAYGVNIYRINNDTGTMANHYTFCPDVITGFEYLGSAIRITLKNGMVLIWDMIEDLPDSDGTELGIKVNHIKQLGGLSLGLSGESIYMIGDFVPHPVFNQYYSDVLQAKKIAIARNRGPYTITENRGLLYIAGRSKEIYDVGGDDFGKTGVMTFGSKKANISPYLNIENVVNNAEKSYSQIYGVISSSLGEANLEEKVYIMYKDIDGNYGVDFLEISDGNYQTVKKGLLVLNSFDGGTKIKSKMLNKIIVNADFGETGGKIEVFKVEKGIFTPICQQYSSEAEKLANSTISFESVDNGEISARKDYEIYPKDEFDNITIAFKISHPGTEWKKDALKIYSITLDYT